MKILQETKYHPSRSRSFWCLSMTDPIASWELIIVLLFCVHTFQTIDGAVIGKVVVSGNSKFQKDDLVLGVFTWAEYSLVKEGNIIKRLESSEFPLSYHLGILGNYRFLHIIYHFYTVKFVMIMKNTLLNISHRLGMMIYKSVL